jgi:hypothetical protein
MGVTEGDQVVELRFAAVRPMLDMMSFAETRAIAAWEAAAAVTSAQRSRDRRRDAARLAADVERLALLAFDDSNDARIAREPRKLFPA